MLHLQNRLGKSLAARRVERQGTRAVAAHAAHAPTAWESWDGYMGKRGALKDSSTEKKAEGAIATAIAKVATSYKPKYAEQHADMAATLKVSHIENLPKQLPKDLHERLEVVGMLQLQNALNCEDKCGDAVTVAYTTTDVNAALAVTGCIAAKGSDRSAVLALVASETERVMSWSRLEGLTLHWACSEARGSAWTMPPGGWSSSPDKQLPADGAVNCVFEKQTSGDNQPMYVLILQLPLRGILKTGGLNFVLKAADAQNTKWLKDAGSDKDFWIDLQSLPVFKL